MIEVTWLEFKIPANDVIRNSKSFFFGPFYPVNSVADSLLTVGVKLFHTEVIWPGLLNRAVSSFRSQVGIFKIDQVLDPFGLLQKWVSVTEISQTARPNQLHF